MNRHLGTTSVNTSTTVHTPTTRPRPARPQPRVQSFRLPRNMCAMCAPIYFHFVHCCTSVHLVRFVTAYLLLLRGSCPGSFIDHVDFLGRRERRLGRRLRRGRTSDMDPNVTHVLYERPIIASLCEGGCSMTRHTVSQALQFRYARYQLQYRHRIRTLSIRCRHAEQEQLIPTDRTDCSE